MTTQATLTPEDAALAAEFAMGLLTPPEANAFKQRMQVNPALLGEVHDWHEHLATLTDGIETRAPRGAKRRLERRLFGVPRRSLWFWQALSGAGITLAFVLGMLFFAQPADKPVQIYAAEITAADDSLRVLAVFDGKSLRLSRTAGQAANDRALELWLIKGNTPPVSLGVLDTNPTSEKPIPDDMRLRLVGGTLAISDEPVGGSPTGQPTGEVLAIGPITTL